MNGVSLISAGVLVSATEPAVSHDTNASIRGLQPFRAGIVFRPNLYGECRTYTGVRYV